MTSLTQSHILIVDDDVNHRAMLRALLSEWGANTDEAGSGTEAVALSKEQPYDLILMDVQMAGMTGIEALRVIKAYNPTWKTRWKPSRQERMTTCRSRWNSTNFA